ncbi:hypothetical protein TPR58_22235 [Sphingomonas sp. HF-S3]|uniref:Lipoprotein n=1 Tax=Sphingomonas rustica TaxID=3103142 RepID=A0ABV0BFN5_9SPHN
MRLLLASALLAGCTAAAPAPSDLPAQIQFATGVCGGTCPAWEASLTDHGGIFTGGQFAQVQGERRSP